MTVPVAHANDTSDDYSGGTELTVSDTGMEAASALATMVYFPAKAIFALGFRREGLGKVQIQSEQGAHRIVVFVSR